MKVSNARKTSGPYVVKPHEDNDLLFRIFDGANELTAIVGKMSFRLTPESCPEQFEHNKASASRVVACLNACEGVSTEVLEYNSQHGGVLRLERQRDQLLAALEEARAFIGEQPVRTETVGNTVYLSEDQGKVMRVMSTIDAAIAAAKASA